MFFFFRVNRCVQEIIRNMPQCVMFKDEQRKMNMFSINFTRLKKEKFVWFLKGYDLLKKIS